MPSYLLLENGDRILLEDGTGEILLETSTGGQGKPKGGKIVQTAQGQIAEPTGGTSG